MHVVLSGYYGFDNVGDEAILFSIIIALRNIQPEIDITVLSNNPDSTKETYQVHAVNRHKLMEVNRVIKQADGLISGGGSLFQDVTGIKSIPYYSGIIQIAKWHKKPVFIYAQGMGPIKRNFCKWIVKRTFNKVERISVRDIESQHLLKQIGVKQETIIVPDPVLGLDGNSFIYEGRLDNHPYITVSVRNWSTDTNYKRKIAKSLDSLVQKGHSIVFVPMHGKYDQVASQEIAAKMKEYSQIIPAESSMQEKIAIIGESELLIGMRLHSLIFSAITCTPFVAISYDPKIDAFASIFKQPVAGHVAEDDWDEKTLYKHVNNSLLNREQEILLLKSKVQRYYKDATDTASIALKTLTTDGSITRILGELSSKR